MKQYVVDEIRSEDHQRIEAHLADRYGRPDLGNIYWIPLVPAVLSSTQRQHDDCRPFYVAVELGPDRIVCELLIRSKKRLQCDCMAYANALQCSWILRTIDDMLQELDIMV